MATQIEHYKTLPYSWFGVSGSYAYGNAYAGTKFYRMDSSFTITEQSTFNAINITPTNSQAAVIYYTLPTTTDGEILAVVIAATNHFFVIRSTDEAANWTTVLRLGQQKATTVSGAHAAGDDTIDVVSAAHFDAGDIAGFTMDNGSIHWSIIDAIVANNIDLTDAIPVGRSLANGAQVYKHVINVRTLGKNNFCEKTDGKLLIAEYNINAARIDGGKNDALNLWESIDNGATWTSIAEWNTNGTHYIRHFHAITQDSNTGYIYITSGDTTDECGIIQWDGSTAITNNTIPKNYNLSGVKGIGGTAAYTGGMPAFLNGYGYMPCDTSTAAKGIYKFPSSEWDFAGNQAAWLTTNYSRVDDDISNYDANAALMSAIKTTANELIVFPYVSAGMTDFKVPIYTIIDGNTWYASGLIGYKDSASDNFVFGAFEWGGKIFAPTNGISAGNSLLAPGTIVFVMSGSSSGTPKVVFPVLYVNGTGGNNAADGVQGHCADAPWETLEYALEAGNCPKGAKVDVRGTTTNSQIAVSLETTGQTTGETLIEAGAVGAIIAGGNATTLFSGISATESPVRFAGTPSNKLRIYNSAAGAVYYGGDINAVVTFDDCDIGDSVNGSINFILRADGAGSVYTFSRCKLRGMAAFSASPVRFYAACTVVLNACIVLDSSHHVYMNAAGGVFSAYHCDFIGYDVTGVLTSATNTEIPTIKNCGFYDTRTGNIGINDGAGLAEADAQIDYNGFYGGTATQNVANSGGSHSVTTDPKIVSVAAGNYYLQPDSGWLNKGVSGLSVTLDYYGNPIPLAGRINIGASNNQYLEGGLSLGLGLSGGNRPPWWNGRR